MPPASWLFPLLLPAGLLAPGWLLGRALRTPAGPAGALLGSAAILTNLVLVLDALHVALDPAHLTAGLLAVCGLFAGIALWRRSRAAVAVPRARFSWMPSHWLLVPAAVGLFAIAGRAIVEPLSGFDTFFRWDFLAREILRVGHLQFYPAVSADDFLHYGWCDGIAPLIATLYLWTYCSLGHVAAWATAPIVIAQGGLLFWLVGQLASRQGGRLAGLAAMALLATNAWVLWAVAMGQETGSTALGLLGMFYFFSRARSEPAARWPVWAGVAAGVAALAREYGLAFILLGGVTMAWQRTPRRGWREFFLAATAVAAPWYLRNWVRTGNPLWSQELGGLFPGNPVLREYLRTSGEINNVFAHPEHLGLAAKLFAVATVPILLGIIGYVATRRDSAPWVLAIGTLLALWFWSIGQTSGGLAYSLRVLAPAFALGAVLGGIWLAQHTTPARAPLLAVLLAIFAGEAAMRSLYLPVWPLENWWSKPAGSWREFGRASVLWRTDHNWQIMADAAGGRKILVSDPTCYASLIDDHARPVPFFSPDVAFLFGAGPDPATRLARLRDLGFRFILLTRGNSVLDLQLPRHPVFRALREIRPAGTTSLYDVYDLFALEPISRPTAATHHAP